MSADAAEEADRLIAALDLAPHPEGGHFRETFRAPAPEGERAASTAILFLLKAGERSHWHRVDATEIWHWHRGGPAEIGIAREGHPPVLHRLGPDIEAGESPQVIVPANAWQATRPLGDYVLVGCTVAPAFDFAHFDLAPPDWRP